mmetsp:Transcript_14577/g.29491  ORF Transcript_14577/g.29491 Transcript_14577/m.29491 type:complete len:306 (+) Transcript_14577:3-920(+)
MDEFTKAEIKKVILAGLAEDLQQLGDLSSQSAVPAGCMARGRFLAKADGVVAGLEVAEMVFAIVNPDIKVQWTKYDGDYVTKGTYFGSVDGPAESVLTAERLALNLMQRMSGIATQTNRMVELTRPYHTKILDTRKTAPGLRYVDKLACVIGGGTNHRMGLYDMVMIKDNHVTAAGSITKAVDKVVSFLKSKNLYGVIPIEVETRTLGEVKEALSCLPKINRVMLDNMVKMVDTKTSRVDTTMLSKALDIIQGAVATEASGNITLETVSQVAKTGVDMISSGALTHSVTALDISLKIKLLPSSKL